MNRIIEMKNKIERIEDQLRSINLVYDHLETRLKFFNKDLIICRNNNNFNLYEFYKSIILDFNSRFMRIRNLKENLENEIRSYNLELTSIILSEFEDFNIRF